MPDFGGSRQMLVCFKLQKIGLLCKLMRKIPLKALLYTKINTQPIEVFIFLLKRDTLILPKGKRFFDSK